MPLSKNGRSKNGDVLCTRVILYEFNQLGNKKILNAKKSEAPELALRPGRSLGSVGGGPGLLDRVVPVGWNLIQLHRSIVPVQEVEYSLETKVGKKPRLGSQSIGGQYSWLLTSRTGFEAHSQGRLQTSIP